MPVGFFLVLVVLKTSLLSFKKYFLSHVQAVCGILNFPVGKVG